VEEGLGMSLLGSGEVRGKGGERGGREIKEKGPRKREGK
jgi:hypothetical protein